MPGSPPTRSRRLPVVVLCVAILLPPCLTGLTIVRDGVDVPYWDEWDLVPVIDRAHSGRLGLAEVVSWHNDHRFIVPRLGVVLQAKVWRWDARIGMWLSFVLAGAAAAAVFAIARQRGDGSMLQPLGMTAIASAFLFSPAQWDNWTMSIQFAFFLPVLAAAGAATLAGTQPVVRIAATSALCLLATASNMTGLALWLVALPLVSGLAGLRPRQSPSSPVRLAIGWLALSALVIALYMVGAPRGAGALRSLKSPADFAAALDFSVCLLGAPLAWGTAFEPVTLARLMGWLLLAGYLACGIGIWRIDRNGGFAARNLPWAMLGAFALIAAGMIGVGRASSGIEQALESRYATLVILFPVAVAGLGLSLAGGPSGSLGPARSAEATTAPAHLLAGLPVVMPFAIGALMTMHVLSAAEGLVRMEKVGRARRAARAALHYVQVVNDTKPLSTLFPDIGKVRERASRLEALNQLDRPLTSTAIVSDDSPGRPGSASGQVESIVTGDDGGMTLSGWAAFDRRRRPADLVGLAWRSEDGADRLFAWAETDPDGPKKKYLWQLRPYLRHASWKASIRIDTLPPAASRLTVWAIDASDGRTYRIGPVVVLSGRGR